MAKTGKSDKVAVSPEQRIQVRRANFVRVVTPRIKKALKAIHLIRNCTSANYDYTPSQAEATIAALLAAVGQVEAAFSKKVQATQEFSLPS